MKIEVSRTEFAQIVGRDTRTVQRWIDAGMPCTRRGRRYVIDVAAAWPWVVTMIKRGHGMVPLSTAERLAGARADAIAMKNEETRRNVALREHVQEVARGMIAALDDVFKTIPVRVAKEARGGKSAPVMRDIMQRAMRCARDELADRTEALFSALTEPKPTTTRDDRDRS